MAARRHSTPIPTFPLEGGRSNARRSRFSANAGRRKGPGMLSASQCGSMSSMCLGQLALSSRDSARSASSLPPVWQRAQ